MLCCQGIGKNLESHEFRTPEGQQIIRELRSVILQIGNISCATESHQRPWGKDWKSQVWDSTSSKTLTDNRILWTVGMKSASHRFKVSVSMKVLRRRHHPSAELRNQQSVTFHKLAVTLSCFHKKSMQCRKPYQCWPQFRVHHWRESRQFQWQYTILLFRRLLHPMEVQKLQWQSLIMEDP